MTLTLGLAFILIYKADIHVLQAFSILWGNILSLTFLDLIVVGVISLTILIMVFLFFKEIQTILYDREIALAVGLPERVFFYLIIFMLGLTIAVSMRMIGALLIDAFVLLPAMAATLIARSLKQIFFFSSLFGLLSGNSWPLPLFCLRYPGKFYDHSGRFIDHRWMFSFQEGGIQS